MTDGWFICVYVCLGLGLGLRAEYTDHGCVQLLSKNQANSFLSSTSPTISTPVECCYEGPCEGRREQCHTEQFRKYLVTTAAADRGFSCPESGKYIQVISWCVGHYMFECSDICDALNGVNRCQNGGTCIHGNTEGTWSCQCVPGYTGGTCEIDIDECASHPCQNGATCEDHINSFKCICPDRFYGVLCDTNICHPTPADIVFVLDSSLSMRQHQFRQQLQFVSNFTDHVHVGPRDLQISVITFSTEARVEFYLDDNSDNETLKNALQKITFKPGATLTDKGLNLVKTVFSPGRGIERRIHGVPADRFVYLLTDGMSTNRRQTLLVAEDLRLNYDVTIAAIGIGQQVSHPELMGVASTPELVYSLTNFNSLHTLLKQLVQHTCDECIRSSRSDVSVIVDTTKCTTNEDFLTYLDTVHQLVDIMELGGETRISLATFDDTLNEIVSLGTNSTHESIKIASNTLEHTKRNDCMNIKFALNSAVDRLMDFSRPNSKRFLIFLTTGNFQQTTHHSDINAFGRDSVSMNEVEVIAIASRYSEGNNIAGLLELAQDPFNVFLVYPEVIGESLNVLKSAFSYNECNLKGE